MADRTKVMLRRERMEITLPLLIDLFATSKQTEGRSPKTVDWYRWLLGKFVGFLGDKLKLAQLSVDDARAFVAALQARDCRYENHPLAGKQPGGLSPYTIHGYVRTLKVFSTWLHEEGFTKTDLFARLKRPKLPEPMVEVLSDQEIGQLVEAINPNSFLGARLYAMVLLLLDTGIRGSELCSLTLDNTDLDQGTIKVLGKGRKERIVPFGAGTKKALLRYLTAFRPESTAQTAFVNPEGGPMNAGSLLQALKRLGRRSGVERLHPHLLRRTFAVKYLMAGGDVMTLRLILGHTTLDVTKLYLHLAESHIKLVYHKFSPVDRLGIGNRKLAKLR